MTLTQRTQAAPEPSQPGTAGAARLAFAARLREATGHSSYAQIARTTGFSAETVRRYLSGRVVSVQFVAAVAETYGVSADWLMLGRGSMRPGPWPAPQLADR